jgi:hypothetical protein
MPARRATTRLAVYPILVFDDCSRITPKFGENTTNFPEQTIPNLGWRARHIRDSRPVPVAVILERVKA